MMRSSFALTLLVAVFAGPALADWELNDPAKYFQLPDLDPLTGLDVKATFPKTLADDFPCDVRGPIYDFHIWGSWKYDEKPEPTQFTFWAGFYSNIPASPDGTDPSRPGELLWDCVFEPDVAGVAQCCAFTERLYYDHNTFVEGWYDPNVPEYLPNNHRYVWQYNFHVDPDDPACKPFVQEGTAATPTVYWLAVSARPPVTANFEFGWKTSREHFEDDAVVGHWLVDTPGNPVAPSDWRPLVYPDGHEFEGKTIDLAFVIVPEPGTVALLVLGAGAAVLRRRRR